MGITVMEIILLIVSAIGFVVSFLIPENGEKTSGVDEQLAQEEIRGLITQEVDAIRSHVDDVVEESMTYAMEKTERSLERLSNEKIMAVNEYSDSVMQEIHKNHEEVMFLYDMLNTKHETLKKTVSEASKAAKVMQDTVESIQTFRPVEVSYGEGSVKIAPVASRVTDEKPKTETVADALEKAGVLHTSTAPLFQTAAPVAAVRREETAEEKEAAIVEAESQEGAVSEEMAEVQAAADTARNSNERILELHAQGKSNVVIAKELGLGVGEVKLVIDLYKNM